MHINYKNPLSGTLNSLYRPYDLILNSLYRPYDLILLCIYWSYRRFYKQSHGGIGNIVYDVGITGPISIVNAHKI